MRLRFILSETFKGLTRNLAMTVSVILVAFISLLFVGASALLQAQISTMKGDWYDKVEVSVYMCPASSSGAACPDGEATQEQIDAVESFINSDALKPYVKSYTFESKAEAYAKFKEVYGERPIGRNATEDMMPVSFRIKLIDAEKYQAVAEQLTGRDGVLELLCDLVHHGGDALFRAAQRRREHQRLRRGLDVQDLLQLVG